MRHSHSAEECSICGADGLWDGCRLVGNWGKVAHARGAANALSSLHDAQLTGKREQEILTPTWMLDLLVQEWGHIELDPCSPMSKPHVPARVHYCGHGGTDGLEASWYDRTYCNPPYGDLKLWLATAQAEHECSRRQYVAMGEQCSSSDRIALLCPVRTHRKWYQAALTTTTAVVELNPVTFEGYKATFPAPLHLLCWGWTPSPALWSERGTVRRYSEVVP